MNPLSCAYINFGRYFKQSNEAVHALNPYKLAIDILQALIYRLNPHLLSELENADLLFQMSKL
jgi:hypothetical protein